MNDIIDDIVEKVAKSGFTVPREVSEMLVKISKLQVAGVFVDAEAALVIEALATLTADRVMRAAESSVCKHGETGGQIG